MRLTQIIESLLFASDAPLSATDLSRVDERLDEDTVEAVIQELRAEYELTERSFQIYEVAGGFQLLTRPEFVTVLERYDSVPQPSRLSAPALEVLAIIAYRQPLGRAEIEDIRGVGSSGVLRTLQERSLIEPVARGEGLGRPLLYGTTSKFLEHVGFRSLEDLPRPDELPVVLRDRTAVNTLPLEDTDAAEASPDAPSAGTESAPDSAESPADSSEAPTDSSEGPADLLEAPIDSAEASVESENMAVESDDAPADSSDAPVESDEAPTDDAVRRDGVDIASDLDDTRSDAGIDAGSENGIDDIANDGDAEVGEVSQHR